MSTIADNIHKIRAQIAQVAHQYQRDPASVHLLAVSKTKPSSAVEEAYQAGQRDFGENYLQDAINKIEALTHLNEIHWHFIGPIQSNKTRSIASHFNWVHSVDRLKIAQRLNDQRPDDLPPLNICLQVNISNEPRKSGIALEALPDLVEQLRLLPRIRVRGLMAIPEACTDIQQQRQPFAALASGLRKLQAQYPEVHLDTLSMGMSADMVAAIAEGATWVRVGYSYLWSQRLGQ